MRILVEKNFFVKYIKVIFYIAIHLSLVKCSSSNNIIHNYADARIKYQTIYGKFWSSIYLFHPKIVVGNNNERWHRIYLHNEPLLSTIKNEKNLALFLNKSLKDFLPTSKTSVIYLNDKMEVKTLQNTYKVKSTKSKTYCYIDCRDYKSYNTPTFFDMFKEIHSSVSANDVIILDLRWQLSENRDKDEVTKYYPLRFFIDKSITKTSYYSREYHGWNEKNYYNVFRQKVSLTDLEPLAPINQPESWVVNWNRKVNFDSLPIFKNKIIVLTNDNTLSICDGYLDYMQNNNNTLVFYDTINSGNVFDKKGLVKLSDSLLLNISQEELISVTGDGEFKFDFKLKNGSSIDSLIYEIETCLSNNKKALTKSITPFNFDLSPPQFLDTIPLTNVSRRLFYFKIWAVINYFHPHKHLFSINWGDVHSYMLSEIEKCHSDSEYFLLLMKLSTFLNDGHASISNSYKLLKEKEYSVPLKLHKFSNYYLVTESLTDAIQPGEMIFKIDGKKVSEIEEELTKYHSFSTPQSKDQWLNFYNRIIRREKDEIVELGILKSKSGETYTTTLEASVIPWKSFQYSRRATTFTINQDSIIYYDLTKEMGLEKLDSLILKYQNYKGLILDMRGFNYTAGTREAIINRLTNKPTTSPIYSIPYVYSTDTLNNNSIKRQEVVEPNDKVPLWRNKVVVLINSLAKSTPENFMMYLRNIDNVVFIGQPTTGTNGNVSEIELPGDFTFTFTNMDVKYANGTSFQNIGIIPDVYVQDETNAILKGDDLILNRAIEYLKFGK